MERITVTIMDATRLTGVSRTAIYELIRQKKLDSLKPGKRRLITMSSLMRFFDPGVLGDGTAEGVINTSAKTNKT